MKYLTDHDLEDLDRRVTRLRGSLDPEMVDLLTRALWELENLRKLSKDLMDSAGAMGLVESEREREAARAARRDEALGA